MFEIFPIQCRPVIENGRRFLKRDAVFLQVGNRLAFVPREHINVYTLIEARGQLLLAAIAKKADYVEVDNRALVAS